MKIFLAFLQSDHKHAIPAYDFWQYYIKNGIEEAGHEWSECPGADWALGLVPKGEKEQEAWKEKVWSQTLNWLKANPADLFLSYLYPEQIDESAISEIKKLGIPCVNFYCDNVRQFTRAPHQFSVFNLNWVPEHSAVKLYQKAGYPHINIPMPVWVDFNQRVLHDEINNDIVFIGSKDIQRLLFFEEVTKKDLPANLRIYGSGWLDTPTQENTKGSESGKWQKINNQFAFIKQHGLIPYGRKLQQAGLSHGMSDALRAKICGSPDFESYNELITGSMVTVGINRYPSYRFPLKRPGVYSRMRDVEAPMLGACYLTEYSEGLEQLYDLGKEIEAFKTADEFIAKAGLLSQHPELRRSLRINGQKKALSEHSIPRSLEKIIQHLT